VVGAASRDLTDDDSRGWRLGGAVTYGALALARLGLDVRAVIGADAAAGTAPELDLLRGAGVDLRIAPLRRGPIFVNEERPHGRRQVALEVSDPIATEALPAAWRSPPGAGVLLAPVAGELGPEWASAAPAGSLVALGWQGLLRRVVRGLSVDRVAPVPHAFLEAAQLIGLSADDLAADVRPGALVDFLRPGATVVITRGDRGGTAFTSRRPARALRQAYRAIAPDRVVDPTGAGDVFLAALLATMLRPRSSDADLGRPHFGDLRFAAAAASLAVEELGLAGVPALEAVLRRAERGREARSRPA
jgi:sugar/nucleoside kinase (ribokinase family)